MMPQRLVLNGLEVATSRLSRRVDVAAPCELLAVIDTPPSTQQLVEIGGRLAGAEISGVSVRKVSDLSFLAHFPELRYLELECTPKLDLSPVSSLDNLRGLYIDSPTAGLDFGRFPLLEEFVGDWHPRNTEPAQHSVREIRVRQFRPLSRDLTPFAGLTGLTSLAIVQTNVATLSGIEFLEDLRRLSVAHAPKLASLDALNLGELGVREVELDHVRKVDSYAPLASLPFLKKLLLSACSPMGDLRWLQSHPRLEFFSFVDTEVASGDLDPLLTVPRLRYVGTLDKRHYNHKCAALNEILAARHEAEV